MSHGRRDFAGKIKVTNIKNREKFPRLSSCAHVITLAFKMEVERRELIGEIQQEK